jgi:hypothetical protein
MVPEALTSVMSNAPDAGDSMQALAIWGLFTFGSLGIGSLGVGPLTGGGTSDSGNVIWVAMNKVAEMTGSLQMTSLIALGGGILLVIIMAITGSGSPSQTKAEQPVYRKDMPEPVSTIPPGKGKACAKCGHMNANWCVSCERCGSMLPKLTGYEW